MRWGQKGEARGQVRSGDRNDRMRRREGRGQGGKTRGQVRGEGRKREGK